MSHRKDNKSPSRGTTEDDLDQRLFVLDDKAHEEFLALLDTPPKPSAALKALMSRRPAWER